MMFATDKGRKDFLFNLSLVFSNELFLFEHANRGLIAAFLCMILSLLALWDKPSTDALSRDIEKNGLLMAVLGATILAADFFTH